MTATALARIRTVLRADIGVLIGFLVVALLALAFLAIASEMREGETLAFDRLILRGLRTPGDVAVPIGPEWLKLAMIDITALGSGTALTLIVIFTTGFLVVLRKHATAAFVAVSVTGGALLGTGLKAVFERARPEVVPHLVFVDTASFPSGHAMNSAVVFLTLAALLARTQRRLAVRVYLMSVAIVLTLAIGFSRVYLGVHWPSDVVAGWCVGAAWAALCGIIARQLQLHRRIEAPDEAADRDANDPPDYPAIVR